ncbi:MAG: hypothetical protein KDK37_12625 [Leptospiraceae bacterium]|nr:hypothetical protein [Leptospiraceae bacterium]
MQRSISEFPELRGPFQSIPLVTALISFTDDFRGPFPYLFFKRGPIKAFIEWLENQNRPLTLPDLFLCPEVRRCENALDSILIIHAALRHIARGRDTRAIGFPMSLERRLLISGNVAPFPEAVSCGGDPLGDAYHYLANLAIGIAITPEPLASRWPIPLFRAGPYLMLWIRQRCFGSILFFGNHRRIDHLGLSHGQFIARELSIKAARLSDKPGIAKPSI